MWTVENFNKCFRKEKQLLLNFEYKCFRKEKIFFSDNSDNSADSSDSAESMKSRSEVFGSLLTELMLLSTDSPEQDDAMDVALASSCDEEAKEPEAKRVKVTGASHVGSSSSVLDASGLPNEDDNLVAPEAEALPNPPAAAACGHVRQERTLLDTVEASREVGASYAQEALGTQKLISMVHFLCEASTPGFQASNLHRL